MISDCTYVSSAGANPEMLERGVEEEPANFEKGGQEKHLCSNSRFYSVFLIKLSTEGEGGGAVPQAPPLNPPLQCIDISLDFFFQLMK